MVDNSQHIPPFRIIFFSNLFDLIDCRFRNLEQCNSHQFRGVGCREIHILEPGLNDNFVLCLQVNIHPIHILAFDEGDQIVIHVLQIIVEIPKYSRCWFKENVCGLGFKQFDEML